jgi:hypothetical protein
VVWGAYEEGVRVRGERSDCYLRRVKVKKECLKVNAGRDVLGK